MITVPPRGLVDAVMDAHARRACPSSRRLLADAGQRAEFRRHVEFVLAECAAALRGIRGPLDQKKTALAASIGVSAAEAELTEADLAQVWTELFAALLATVARIVAELGPADPAIGVEQPEHTVVLVMHRAIAARSHAAAAWHATAGTHRARRTVADERRALARELHDWFGSNLSVVQRRLELHRVATGAVDRHLTVAEDVLAELFDGVRRYAAGLRVESPVEDLGAALRGFVESVENGSTSVEVMVRGDDALLPPDVRAELFMILREALRNVFAHAAARRAVVLVEIAADRACAVVRDDGVGIVARPPGERSGTGLLSMRERAERLGGDVAVGSSPGHGTRIECWIPTGEK